MSLIGTLTEVKLADVLRLFAAGRKSGVLTVAASGARATLRFEKGALVHAVAGKLQGDEAVLDLFGWNEGQLTFLTEEPLVTPNVSKSLDALVLEGVRVGGLVHRIHEVVSTDRLVFELAAGPTDESFRFAMSPATWRVVRVLDGVRDVREAIEASKLPRGDVHRILVELHDAGLVERFDVQKSLRVQVQGLFGGEVAEIDEKLEGEWRKMFRFRGGVSSVEVRTLVGRTRRLGAAFRPGLVRDVHLPRAVAAELQARDGEDVTVRPVGPA